MSANLPEPEIKHGLASGDAREFREAIGALATGSNGLAESAIDTAYKTAAHKQAARDTLELLNILRKIASGIETISDTANRIEIELHIIRGRVGR